MPGMHRRGLMPGSLRRQHILRRAIQLVSLAAMNLHVSGLLTGRIFTGTSKLFCVPGLHCYSCPSSVLACPLGSLQSVISSPGFLAGLSTGSQQALIVLGVLGFILLPGFVAGSIACAYVCPFGLLQELLYRVPSPKLTIPRSWRYGRLVMALLFVLLLPMFLKPSPGSAGDPWFCKVVCPEGTLTAGWPMALHDGGKTLDLGFLFGWKSAILVLILLWSVVSKRPFCRVLCPLGAFWGTAGKVSLFRMRVDSSCIRCDRCKDVCPVDLAIYKHPDSASCIRCGECIRACPVDAISHSAKRPDHGGERNG